MTCKVKKWKARLNIDGSKMTQGIDYEETYVPVASRNSIELLLTLTAVHGWYSTQLNYVLSFPQVPVEKERYMKIPRGFEINREDSNDYGEMMYVLYMDDSLLAGPDQNEINQIIEDLKKARLDIMVEGWNVHLTQPHLIDNILHDLNLDKPNTVTKTTPALRSKILFRHSYSEPFDKSFEYRSVIGKLNYLEKATRSDIAYITHQCARFSSDPKVEHEKAIRWLLGNWEYEGVAEDIDTARSRHGYIIMYAGCHILWKSQMQTEFALSTTESEYTGLSYALRSAILIMEQLKEKRN
eukprot:scaffold241829_cov35-Attheya_sp.AAC.2